jgi:hypothetical protein
MANKPDFIVRTRQEPGSEFMMNIGAAWKWKKGEGYVVKLYARPLKWDYTFVLSPRKEGEAEEFQRPMDDDIPF